MVVDHVDRPAGIAGKLPCPAEPLVRVTVEVHECIGCGKPGGIRAFNGKGLLDPGNGWMQFVFIKSHGIDSVLFQPQAESDLGTDSIAVGPNMRNNRDFPVGFQFLDQCLYHAIRISTFPGILLPHTVFCSRLLLYGIYLSCTPDSKAKVLKRNPCKLSAKYGKQYLE